MSEKTDNADFRSYGLEPELVRPGFDPDDFIVSLNGRTSREIWRDRWTRFVAAVRHRLGRRPAA